MSVHECKLFTAQVGNYVGNYGFERVDYILTVRKVYYVKY